MRRVGVSSFALFALVFTLLTFRLTTGQDPSTGNTVATTNTPSLAAPSIVSSNEDNESEASGESDDDAYSSGPDNGSSSAGSTTPSQTPTPAPTTAAS